jgi:integrase
MKDTPMYELYQRVAPRPEDFPRLLDKIGESMAKDFDLTEEVRGLQVPTLIVAADADMAPPSHYVEVFKLLDGGLRDGGWMGEGRPKGGHALAILPGLTPLQPLQIAAVRRGHPLPQALLGRRVSDGKAPAPTPRRPVTAPPAGLAAKTVVNTHRMLHKAWEDFVAWGWAKRNVVKDAHLPRVPRRKSSTWTVEQLQRFLMHARKDRFFALWVLEATSGIRRSELAGARRDGLDRQAGSLSLDVTRVVVDGKVVESDGKTENAQRIVALDPLTLAVLDDWVGALDSERRALGDAYDDHGLLFRWPDGRSPHPDTITARFKRLVKVAELPMIRLHDVRHSYATLGRDAGVNWKTLSQRIGHADVAFTMRQYVHTDLQADHIVARALADLILSDALLADPDDEDPVSKSVSTDDENAR